MCLYILIRGYNKYTYHQCANCMCHIITRVSRARVSECQSVTTVTTLQQRNAILLLQAKEMERNTCSLATVATITAVHHRLAVRV